MRVLLVEPNYRRLTPGKNREKEHANSQSEIYEDFRIRKTILDDETLWYPPLGLMKLARFHCNRGDEIKFVRGCDSSILGDGPLFADLWDRVYITTLFTYHFDQVVKTIRYYLEAVGGTVSKVYVGGIMASIMVREIYEATGVKPIPGILTSAEIIDLPGNVNIDELPPDYSILDSNYYAINDTYYAYTTRGCRNKCKWCGVPIIEPKYIGYIDIKETIYKLRDEYGDKAVLRLMDNNVLASNNLEQIIQDLIDLGYGRDQYTNTYPKKLRVVDFNQGLDSSYINEKSMKLLSQINVRPMRIAFDLIKEKKYYINALNIANRYGVSEFSNYMLYNFNDTPRDLYDRLMINIELNQKWLSKDNNRLSGKIYSYPMRFAPISDPEGIGENKRRDRIIAYTSDQRDWLNSPVWTKRFIRNIELMKGAANGAISPTPSLARRTIGESFEEFITNLYMPEELIRNRNKHEKKIYEFEPKRKPGTGKVEEFRKFILGLLKKQDKRFCTFHHIVSVNSKTIIKKYLTNIHDKELKKWMKMYL